MHLFLARRQQGERESGSIFVIIQIAGQMHRPQMSLLSCS
jgi:hypothetical protein